MVICYRALGSLQADEFHFILFLSHYCFESLYIYWANVINDDGLRTRARPSRGSAPPPRSFGADQVYGEMFLEFRHRENGHFVQRRKT